MLQDKELIMFERKTYKIVLFTFLQAILLIVLLAGYLIEFISYFLITDSFTFLDMPIGNASVIEFIIFALLSSLLGVISIIVIKMKKISSSIEYIICTILVCLNILMLIYFIPSISFDKPYFFYTIKQFVPLITNSLPILFGLIKISEIKYEKYR